MGLWDIYADEQLDGYNLTLRTLQNPSLLVKQDFYEGDVVASAPTLTVSPALLAALPLLQTLHSEDTAVQAGLDELISALTFTEAAQNQESQRRRAALGRALHAFFGTAQVSGLNFSTPEAALATVEREDLPDEPRYWLFNLPYRVMNRRREVIAKNLFPSSEQSST